MRRSCGAEETCVSMSYDRNELLDFRATYQH
jgi:hypothetical protein